MNDSNSLAQASRLYEQHKVVIDKKNFESWAEGSKCYEQLWVVVDENDSRSSA